MSSRYRPRPATTPLTGARASARMRDRRIQRWVILLFVIVLAVVVAIPAVGYFVTFVLPPRHVVVDVNGSKHTLGEVAKRSRASTSVIMAQGGQPDYGTLPFETLNNLVDEELLRQNASKVGVSVSPDDVDAEVRRLHFPTPPAGEQVDQASLEKEYQEKLRQYFNITGYSSDEYRAIVRATLLRQRITDTLSSQIPSVEDQVYVHWIRVTDQTVAETVQQRLAKSENFASLARTYLGADAYADANGEVGWTPKGAFPSLDLYLFPEGKTVELNKVSDPITAGDGSTYFLKVTAGPETREISDRMKSVLKTQAMQVWMNSQRDANKVNVTFTSDDYAWVVSKAKEIVPAALVSTPTR